MGTILLILSAVVAEAAFLLLTGLKNLKKSVGPWDAAGVNFPLPRVDRHRFQERRHHIVDYPYHRRRSDDTGGES
ncbi:MAG TPA: hypothetical protein VNZ54_11065 [bacterium]|nr:hypothetical protein [bacterium]HXB98583.1 hypothetical protein [bacterium]